MDGDHECPFLHGRGRKFRHHRRSHEVGAAMDAKYRNGMVFPRVAGTQADVEALCDDESGVCLDGDEGVFWEEVEMKGLPRRVRRVSQ